MKEKTVLVIDDSSTIRRLCDSELSAAGYQVLMAPTAEEGISKAESCSPDVIILDHQLPGTTGYDVACQLLENPTTAMIPVVASSTLRKKAYAEYLNCDNVVDMLPKPYTPEALVATIANAINTAQMVVQSQCDGSSVPEVIDELGESALSGAFGCFGLREILDMLNNGEKSGVLEVETVRHRVFVFIDKGRIQAVTGSGVDPELVTKLMPDSLAELAPVIKLTVNGRKGSEVDGLVELLNNKVLDPRLLKKLLRLQAAVLLRVCFTEQLKSFRFDQNQQAPPLFQNLPLDSSQLSLLVEGSLTSDESDLPEYSCQTGFVRKAIRGQNLDRAGLASRHIRLMSLLSEPVSVTEISSQLGWSEDETRRVVHGFELAELIESKTNSLSTKVFGVMSSVGLGQKTASFCQSHQDEFSGKIVRDWLALRLLLRRSRPDVLLVELQDSNDELDKLLADPANPLEGVRIIGFKNEELADSPTQLQACLDVDFDEQSLYAAITSTTPETTDSASPVLEPAAASLSLNSEV